MKQLKKTKRPVVLTVKGKAAAIVQDARSAIWPGSINGSMPKIPTWLSGGIEGSGGRSSVWKSNWPDARQAPENGELRHLLYGHKSHVYRAMFRLLEKQKRVDVLHIRHGARRGFKEPDAGRPFSRTVAIRLWTESSGRL
jgi:hypothetical protein